MTHRFSRRSVNTYPLAWWLKHRQREWEPEPMGTASRPEAVAAHPAGRDPQVVNLTVERLRRTLGAHVTIAHGRTLLLPARPEMLRCTADVAGQRCAHPVGSEHAPDRDERLSQQRCAEHARGGAPHVVPIWIRELDPPGGTHLT